MTISKEKLQEIYNKSKEKDILYLIDQNLTSADLPLICEFLNNNIIIKKLNLQRAQIDSDGAKILAAHTTLEFISLADCNLGDEGAIALANNTHLKTVTAIACRIGDDGAKALALNTNLISLNLSGNNITDIGAEAFINNNTLNSLNLSFNKINKKLIDRLLKKNYISCDFQYNLKEKFDVIPTQNSKDPVKPPLDLTAIKEKICTPLLQYTAWWKLSIFGHHHENRAKQMLALIKQCNSIYQINLIIKHQLAIFENKPKNFLLEEPIIQEDRSIRTLLGKLIDRWFTEPRNKPKNILKSGYYHALQLAHEEIEKILKPDEKTLSADTILSNNLL